MSSGRTAARTARCKSGWAKSSDHGQTWTQLGVVNTVSTTDAHTPSVAVDELGTVAVSYYDYRLNVVNSNDG